MNSVNITGRLTRDAQERATAGGLSVCNFSLAVNDYQKGEEYTSFIDVVMFDKPNLIPKLRKGVLIGVTGKLKQSRWETQGQKRSKLEVIAFTVDVLERVEQPETPAQSVSNDLYDADIPF